MELACCVCNIPFLGCVLETTVEVEDPIYIWIMDVPYSDVFLTSLLKNAGLNTWERKEQERAALQDSLWRTQVKRVSRLRVPTCEKFLHKPDGEISWLYFLTGKSRFYTSIYQLFTYSNLPRPSQVFFYMGTHLLCQLFENQRKFWKHLYTA